MRTVAMLTFAVATFASVPLPAQQVDAHASGQQGASASAAGARASDASQAGVNAEATDEGAQTNLSANESAKTTYAPSAAGWGNDAASHAWEMSSVSGELQGKLNTKTAKVGDRVVLKTMDKVQTPDGTVIPKGSRLIGHVTEVQAHDQDHASSHLGIAFDRVEMKDGENFAVYTLLKGVTPNANASSNSSMLAEDSMSASMPGGRVGGTGTGSGRGGGVLGAAGTTLNNSGGVAGGVVDRTAETTERAGSGLGTAANSAVDTAGHGDLDVNTGAHAAAAARMTPHATAIPGVMLAGNSTASGVFSASRQNLTFESGTRMQLGIVANR